MVYMSLIGGPISASVAGAPEAQKRASDTKQKRRNDEVKRRRQFEDSLQLHISEVEAAEAAQAVQEHASDDPDSEGKAKPQPNFKYHSDQPSSGTTNPPNSPTPTPTPMAYGPTPILKAPATSPATTKGDDDPPSPPPADDQNDQPPPSHRSIDITG